MTRQQRYEAILDELDHHPASAAYIYCRWHMDKQETWAALVDLRDRGLVSFDGFFWFITEPGRELVEQMEQACAN